MRFKDFTELLSIILNITGIAIALLIILGFAYAILDKVYDCYRFRNSPIQSCEATLIYDSYTGSTLQSHTGSGVSVVGGKAGVHTTTYTTGSSEKFVTIWDCGKHGRMKSDKEHIFRFAKPESILYFRQRGNNYCIVDIQH